MFKRGEKAFLHCVIPAAALGRHAGGDLVELQQLPIAISPILAALIGVDQEFIGFDLEVA